MSYESPFPHNPAQTPEEEIYNAHFFLKMMDRYFNDTVMEDDPSFNLQAVEALRDQAMVAIKAVIAVDCPGYFGEK